MTRERSARSLILSELERLERSHRDEAERSRRDGALLALAAAGVPKQAIIAIMLADFGVKWKPGEISQRVKDARKRTPETR